MRQILAATLALGATFAAGCTHNHLQVPVTRSLAFPKVASQQRLVSTSVEKAFADLEMEKLPLRGREFRVKAAGVYFGAKLGIYAISELMSDKKPDEKPPLRVVK